MQKQIYTRVEQIHSILKLIINSKLKNLQISREEPLKLPQRLDSEQQEKSAENKHRNFDVAILVLT